MILTPGLKTDEFYNEVRRITHESFEGVQLPPDGLLRGHFDVDDVFVSALRPGGLLRVNGFSLVTERDGCPHVFIIATDPLVRGRGFATQSLEEISTFYRQKGRQSITLNVHVDNPAQKVYFDNGYRIEKFVRKYYGHEGDGIFMRRIL